MKSRFVFSCLAVLVALSMLLAACQPAAPQAAPTQPAAAPTQAPPEPTQPPAAPTQPPAAAPTSAPASSAATKVTIFVGFGAGNDPTSIELQNKIAEEFNSTHKDIQIEFTIVAYEEHISKFSTFLAGDMAPDLVFPIGVMGVAEFYDEWMDIAPLIKKDNYDTSDFYGPALEMNTYKDKTIGLPIGVYPSAMFYNENLFDKAGLPYPPEKYGDPTWTYDKVVEIAKKMTLDENGNASGSAKFNPEKIVEWGWDGWDWMPFRMVPGKFGGNPWGLSADLKTAEMNKGAYVEGMQFVQDTIWKDHVRPTNEETTALFTDIDPMQSGKVAMWELPSWIAYAYSTWTEAFTWNAAPVPAGKDGKVVVETNADVFAIPKHAKHPEAAWEVAKWLLQPENMKRLTQAYGCIPARKSLADGWMSEMQAQYPKVNFQVFLDGIQYADNNPNHESWVPNYQKIWDATENAMSKITSGESKNVQEVMDALNKEVQGYLDEYWAAQK